LEQAASKKKRGRSADRGLADPARKAADRIERNPNAQIVYLLHKKIVVNDRTDSQERNKAKGQLDELFRSVTWITYRSHLD
jgi:hypothetical protein